MSYVYLQSASLQGYLCICPVEVIGSHILEIVGVISISLATYYVPLQRLAIQFCHLLGQPRCGLGQHATQIATELVRVYLYYARGCSDVGLLVDTQRGTSDSGHLKRITADRLSLMDELHSFCTRDLPRILCKE